MTALDRARYAALYGPTTGDRIRLADTDLLIEIEKDHCVGGDEAVFGGGKGIRESMGQSRATPAGGALDTVITRAVVVGHWGVRQAQLGIRGRRVRGPGRAGSNCTRTGARPRRRLMPVYVLRTPPGYRCPSIPIRSTRPGSCRTPWRPSTGGPSTRTTPKARVAGTLPTSSPSPRIRTCCRRRRTRPGRTLATPWPSTSTC